MFSILNYREMHMVSQFLFICFKSTTRNTRTLCEICSVVTIKTSERRHNKDIRTTSLLTLNRFRKLSLCLTVCYYLVTYAFQSESTLYSCLIVVEDIWIINGSNPNWTHNHLVLKRTLNHKVKLASLAKWLSVRFPSSFFLG